MTVGTFDDPGRRAGLLYLAVAILGAFGLLYAPSQLIVPGDVAATARNVSAAETTYRLAVVSGLASAVLFLFLARALRRLLAHVHAGNAALMVSLVNVAVAIGFALAAADLAALAALRDAGVLAAFGPAGREALAVLGLRASRQGLPVAQVFWGLWLFPFGALVMRSGFIPRILGVLLIVNGAAYVTASLVGLLLPAQVDLANRMAVVPELGEVWIMLWLLFKGARPRPPGR